MKLPGFPLSRVLHFLNMTIIVVSMLSCNDDEDEPPISEVTAVTPASALPNSVVAITGKDFSTVFNENKVTFKGKDALVLNASSTQLNVVVPAGAETGPVTVTVKGKEARNQPMFTVEIFPSVISNVSPLSGGHGTVVTIAGSNFLAIPESNTVTFNGVPAIVQTATATSLTVKVPGRAGSGSVIVNGVAAISKFTYIPDVYIVGNVYGKDGYSRATYWKNGIATTVGAPGQHSYGLDIAFAGDDVYVTGSKVSPFSLARLWKNGTEILLSDDKYPSAAEAIVIVGTDVYIAGHEGNSSGKIFAKYWKNGTPVALTHGTAGRTHATGIGVNGQDVYVAGNSLDASGTSFATYWKNGTPHHLSTVNSYGWSMFLSGSDIFVTGSERSTGPGLGFVTHWKNDAVSRLSPGVTGGAGRDIVVSGNDIYVAGVEDNVKGFRVAKYWKNGSPISLSDGSSDAYAYAIDVIGEDVYVAGAEYSVGGVYVVKLWKNGAPFSITDGGYDAMAEGLALH